MALLSRYNYAPKDINDGVHVWADCSQSMLDTVDPDVAIAYIRSRNHKVPPQFGERDVTLLEEYTEAGLSIGTLGACAMAAATYAYGFDGTPMQELATGFTIGSAVSLIGTPAAVCGRAMLADHGHYGPFAHWRAYQKTRQLRKLIGEQYQPVTSTVRDLQCMINERNSEQNSSALINPFDTAALAQVVDRVMPDQSALLAQYEMSDALRDPSGYSALRHDVHETLSPHLDAVYKSYEQHNATHSTAW